LQAFISLFSKIQALSEQEIFNLVPNDILNELKKRDAHPFLQAYIICHEGISNPKILGDTSRPIHWTRQAVQSIKDIVLKGVKFFTGHNKDNSTENREALGEIIYDTQKEIDGNLSHIVVGYFPDKNKVLDKDICSQESEWNFIELAGNWIADKVHKLTGIALASSKDSLPAFQNAKRLGMVQALEDDKGKEKKMDLTICSFSELLQELKKRHIEPSQMFSIDEIKSEKAYSSIIKTDKDLKELEDTKKKAIDLETENKTLKTEKESNAKLIKEHALLSAKERYLKIAQSLTLTAKQREFVTKQFNETIQDTTEEGLKKYIDSQLNVYSEVVKSLNIKTEIPAQKTNNENQSDSTDLTKAENNELLEEDLQTV
jgi:hypothetical protein